MSPLGSLFFVIVHFFLKYRLYFCCICGFGHSDAASGGFSSVILDSTPGFGPERYLTFSLKIILNIPILIASLHRGCRKLGAA